MSEDDAVAQWSRGFGLEPLATLRRSAGVCNDRGARGVVSVTIQAVDSPPLLDSLNTGSTLASFAISDSHGRTVYPL